MEQEPIWVKIPENAAAEKKYGAPSGTSYSGEKGTSEKCGDSGEFEAVSSFLSQSAACGFGTGFCLLWKSSDTSQRTGHYGNQKWG